MTQKETRVQKIVRLTSQRFPIFPERVDADQVVRFVLTKRNELESTRRKKNDPGNDARDITMISGLLKSLPSETLSSVQLLKQREIRRQLRNNSYPFSLLNKKIRETLLHLPISWIREGAQWQLNVRNPIG